MRSLLREATMTTTDKYKQIGKKKGDRWRNNTRENERQKGSKQLIVQRVEIMWQSTRPHPQRRSAPLPGGALPLRLSSKSFMEHIGKRTAHVSWVFLLCRSAQFRCGKFSHKSVVCNKHKGKETASPNPSFVLWSHHLSSPFSIPTPNNKRKNNIPILMSWSQWSSQPRLPVRRGPWVSWR